MVCPFVMKIFERLEEFLCIGWLCYLSWRLVEQEDQLLWLEEFLWYHLSLLSILTKLFLVCARARMCDYLPLVAPPNTHRESLRLLSYNSPIYWEIYRPYVRRETFFLLDITLLMGRCNWVHNEFRPCGNSDSLQSKEVLVSYSLVNASTPRYSVIWRCNKFESVISSLFVPWISRVLIRFHFWFQFHTSYLLAFSGYIYGLRL